MLELRKYSVIITDYDLGSFNALNVIGEAKET